VKCIGLKDAAAIKKEDYLENSFALLLRVTNKYLSLLKSEQMIPEAVGKKITVSR
jgi:hypothetical protein